MTPAGPNRRGPSARRAHRQACARSANSARCSGADTEGTEADQNGGYRVLHDRRAVTVGNEAPVRQVWYGVIFATHVSTLPTPSSAATSSATCRLVLGW